MKKIIVLPIWICLLLLVTVACKNSPREKSYSPPPLKGSPTISITNIEIQPNPFHLWPSSNYKLESGQYRVVISLTNTGTDVCTSRVFFTLNVRKADQNGNFNTQEFAIGGATLDDQILVNEKRYVIIPIENWVVGQASINDYDGLAGSYRTRLEVATNDRIPIDQNIPASLFQIIKH
ncbi:MAG TPA: hypothetical protein VF487_13415 [Chitinophagaceae bacterium]